MDTSPADEIFRLRRENEILSQQVKRLIRAESQMYEFQEELDAQLKEYKELYDLNRRLYASPDLNKIFEESIKYAIYHLEYERAVCLLLNESGRYTVAALDGYYDLNEKAHAAALSIVREAPLIAPLLAGSEYLICREDCSAGPLLECRDQLLMHEYLIYPLGDHQSPLALLAVGNSAAKARFYHRVDAGEGALLGIGNLVGMVSSAVEKDALYSGLRNAVDQERQAEANYRDIFENALEGIFRTTPAGGFISCNPATAAILGYESPQEVIRCVTDLGRQVYVDQQRRQELYDLLGKGESVRGFEIEFYSRDGNRRWVVLCARPVCDSNGKLLYLDGIIQDISARKESEEALRKLNEELEQRVARRTDALEKANAELRQVTQELESANAELKSAQSRFLQQEKMASIGQLAAGVAHEINNPMGFIISNLSSLGKYSRKLSEFVQQQSAVLERLAEQTDPAAGAEVALQRKALKVDYILADLPDLISQSLEGAERVRKIVQDLKSFSRLDECALKLADINECLESTINIVWNELKYKAVLKKDLGDIPRTSCNPGQLNQVFMNILVNAAQAMETPGEITVRSTSDNNFIQVQITDNGSGIPPQILARIFEPFYTTKEVGKGTGLGLSIAYDIIKKHSGEIQVESEVGKGTIFTVSIPIV